MNISPTPIDGVFTVDTKPFIDHRGVFARLFCTRELSSLLGARSIRQADLSVMRQQGALRGLHFQRPPYDGLKLLRVLRGRIFAVAADLRRTSPTFLKWHGEILSADNRRLLAVPEGCAHGYQALEADSEVFILSTKDADEKAADGLRYDEPALGIAWPLPVTDLSGRDASHPLIGLQANRAPRRRSSGER